MLRTVRPSIERHALRTPFRIARGVRDSIDVAVVELQHGTVVARGEGTPTSRYGETPEMVIEQIEKTADAIADGADRAALRALLPAGAARNALDNALWDLEARLAGTPYAPPVKGLVSARTISIDTPDAMAKAALALADARLIKVKLDGNDPAARLRAVRDAAPDAVLIVDANEGWSLDLLRNMEEVLVDCAVKLVEQPLPAGQDAALAGIALRVPLCADESCHVAADVPRLRDLYDFVNIKLDKTGGLTEALELLAAARIAGMGVLVGCMLGTSLGMAPAMRVAALADYADLDGPWWLREDRPGGLTFAADGSVGAPDDALWTCSAD
ncbi:N-acetyl-D-Glu racemase DgcA [Sphingomonas olei]|uniref:Dipeptide epimerase n=1 Tax=Sphingomonas olei TaxID=1886787 RepID=A0ABY2QE85_9SPHN|nr:N-acetyl-D-Glu racemase DgcA [Sphingomonas olei]THG37588.1 dipeptide epimerase [Sphingomonas olei]